MFESLPGDRPIRLSWLLAALLAATVVGTAIDDDLVWTAFLALALAILLLPPVVARDPGAVLPPAPVALAVLPGATRLLGPSWLTDYAVYAGVAAVALAVVVELSLFTDAEMSPRFADAMVVLTTMAAIGVWVVLQFGSDRFLGTDLLATKRAANLAFVRATVAGVVAAAVFELHFDYDHPVERDTSDLPEGERG